MYSINTVTIECLCQHRRGSLMQRVLVAHIHLSILKANERRGWCEWKIFRLMTQILIMAQRFHWFWVNFKWLLKYSPSVSRAHIKDSVYRSLYPSYCVLSITLLLLSVCGCACKTSVKPTEHKIHSCTYYICWEVVCTVGIERPAISHFVCCHTVAIVSLNQHLCPLCLLYVKHIKQLSVVQKQTRKLFHAFHQQKTECLYLILRKSRSSHKSTNILLAPGFSRAW